MATTPQPHSTAAQPEKPADPEGDRKKLLLLLVTDWLEGDRKHADEIAGLVQRIKAADEGQSKPAH